MRALADERRLSNGGSVRIAIDTLFEHATRPSSAVDFLVNLATYLPRVGPQHSYHLLVGRRGVQRYECLRRHNVSLVDCLVSNEHRALRIFMQQSLIPWQMKRMKVDVLFAAGNVCPVFGDFCRVLKINTLHHYRTPEMIGYLRSAYRGVAFARSAKVADCIMANSNSTRDDICHFLGVDDKKVKVVWEAVDDSFVPTTPEQMDSMRQRYGLKREYILFSSTLWPYKNAETLIRAFAKVVIDKHLDYELLLVGRVDDASYEARLKQLAQQMGVADRVRFMGFFPNREMPPLYSAARVFVYPSLSETFGKPLVEAMRCGVPIVASNISCIPEVLGGAGLLVAPLDVDQMATAIYRTAVEEPLRTELIARGSQRGECFSWQAAAQQILAVIEETFVNWKASRNGA
jgi:glycosyltransferase involved in cell wall biosynthesis